MGIESEEKIGRDKTDQRVPLVIVCVSSRGRRLGWCWGRGGGERGSVRGDHYAATTTV